MKKIKKFIRVILLLLYILSPIDILPEVVVGPTGYLDDVVAFLAMFAD